MTVKAFERICLSVSTLEESLAFYRDWVGMEVVGSGEFEISELRQAWGLPVEMSARFALLKNEPQSTLLELVEFQPGTSDYIRPNPRSLDYGYWGMSFLVRDLDGLVRELKARGFVFTSEPVTYYPAFTSYGVKTVTLVGPERVPVYHFERLKPEPSSGRSRYLELNHLPVIVESIEQFRLFFGELLGMKHGGEFDDTGGLNDMFDMPAGAGGREGFYLLPEGKALTVNYVFVKPSPGRQLSARPPARGIFLASFEVDNLDELLGGLPGNGFPVLSGPLHLKKGRRSLLVSGPSGIALEIFQTEEG